MIGFLKGEVLDSDLAKNSNYYRIILLVNNVGYEIYCSNGFAIGSEASLYISTVVRDDSISLYAFDSKVGKDLFEKLISVSGIGPKVALSIFVALGLNDIFEAIEAEDVKRLSKTPGLGNKGASRIVLELKGKLVVESKNSSDKSSEAHLALRSLGYSKLETEKALKDVDQSLSVEEQIKYGLQRLAK